MDRLDHRDHPDHRGRSSHLNNHRSSHLNRGRVNMDSLSPQIRPSPLHSPRSVDRVQHRLLQSLGALTLIWCLIQSPKTAFKVPVPTSITTISMRHRPSPQIHSIQTRNIGPLIRCHRPDDSKYGGHPTGNIIRNISGHNVDGRGFVDEEGDVVVVVVEDICPLIEARVPIAVTAITRNQRSKDR